ncbi:MAG: type II toxin-antitoxin system VapC family toxin [Pseudomonadota bacterium]|nr:type II toxin-antitoxin system VapC family toxin [Pseudomonadota bacterium]
MVIDSSAVVAILFDEPEAQAFLSQMAIADVCRLSAANLVEVGIVLRREVAAKRRAAFDEMLRLFSIQIEPVTEAQAYLALDAYDRFGKGTGHPAGLNYGDCFSYALAKQTGEPLLFKGNDFTCTDLEAAC